MTAVPGLPREVRAGDDRLAQMCGCNMAITRSALLKVGGFDSTFTTAGDDVDLSWRLEAAGETLAYAPGASVLHERRATLAAYLRQQCGYGAGEGLLFRKYPLRSAAEDGMYASASWLGSLVGGARVYYGAFGRGLFQTAYSTGSQYADLPLTIQWIAASLILLMLGAFNRFLGVLGGAGLALTVLVAAAAAASAPVSPSRSGLLTRIYLWILNLAGPSVRSLARERVKWRIEPMPVTDQPGRALEFDGSINFAPSNGAAAVDLTAVLAQVRESLVHRGVAVAETDGFQSYDLEVVMPPLMRAPINAVRGKDGSLTLLWRLRLAPQRALIAAAIVFLILLAAGLPIRAAIVAVLCAGAAIGLFAIVRASRIPSIVNSSAAEAGLRLGIRVTEPSEASA